MNPIKTIKNEIFKSKFSRDSVWILTSQVILATNGILLNIFISNFYSTKVLGIFSQALSFFLILTAISNLGLYNTTVKYISESVSSSEILKKEISTNLILGVSVSILLVLFMIPLLHFNTELLSSLQVTKATISVILAIPFFTANRIFMGYFNGIRNMKIYSLMRIFRWLSYIIFFVLISVVKHNFYFALYSILITEIILLLLVLTKEYKLLNLKLHVYEIKKNISFGSKSFLSEIVSYSQDRLDIIVIGYILTASDVGLYSFAASIAKGILIIPTVFMQNVNPIISKLWIEKKISEIQEYITKLKRYSVKIMVPFSLLVIILYFILINYFMPFEFTGTMIIFLIMLLAAFMLSIISWSGGFLIMTGNLYPNLVRVILLLFVSAILNLILANYFGLLGAASAYLIFALFFVFIQNLFLKKNIKISLV